MCMLLYLWMLNEYGESIQFPFLYPVFAIPMLLRSHTFVTSAWLHHFLLVGFVELFSYIAHFQLVVSSRCMIRSDQGFSPSFIPLSIWKFHPSLMPLSIWKVHPWRVKETYLNILVLVSQAWIGLELINFLSWSTPKQYRLTLTTKGLKHLEFWEKLLSKNHSKVSHYLEMLVL